MSVPIDTMSLSTKARRRMRTSREETAILESFYSKNPNPNAEQKQEIADAVKMGPKNVHFWFQNRRAKDNKKRKLLQQMRQQELAQQQQQSPRNQVSPPPQEGLQLNANSQQQIKFYHQQQQQHHYHLTDKNKFNLPPISSIMVPNSHNFSIPYYFHHSKFGIEDCMLQMQEINNDMKY